MSGGCGQVPEVRARHWRKHRKWAKLFILCLLLILTRPMLRVVSHVWVSASLSIHLPVYSYEPFIHNNIRAHMASVAWFSWSESKLIDSKPHRLTGWHLNIFYLQITNRTNLDAFHPSALPHYSTTNVWKPKQWYTQQAALSSPLPILSVRPPIRKALLMHTQYWHHYCT